MISGGERQLALLARALAQEPQFIVLDEPTASLDFGNQGKVMREIRALAAAGHGVLFTTHDPNHAMRAADRAYLLRDGTRIAEGAIGAVLNRAQLEVLYGAPVETITDRRRARSRFCRVEQRNWNGQDQGDERGRGGRPGERACAGVHARDGHEVELELQHGRRACRSVSSGGEKPDVIILSFPVHRGAGEGRPLRCREPRRSRPRVMRRRGARRHDDARTSPRSKPSSGCCTPPARSPPTIRRTADRPASISPTC